MTTPILVEYESIDFYVFFDGEHVDEITAYAGKDRKTGEDKYTWLTCLTTQAEDAICELAIKARFEAIKDEAEFAAEDAAADAYERSYGYFG